jgi:hypothetical protein
MPCVSDVCRKEGRASLEGQLRGSQGMRKMTRGDIVIESEARHVNAKLIGHNAWI